MFLVLTRWTEKERWIQDFLFSSQEVWELSFRPNASEGRNRVCVCVCVCVCVFVCVCSVCKWLREWWLVFVLWSLMLLWVMGVRFDNTCTVSGKWNVSRVIPRLYGWVYKTLRLSTLVVEHIVLVMSGRLNPMGSQFWILVLWNLCSESGGH